VSLASEDLEAERREIENRLDPAATENLLPESGSHWTYVEEQRVCGLDHRDPPGWGNQVRTLCQEEAADILVGDRPCTPCLGPNLGVLSDHAVTPRSVPEHQIVRARICRGVEAGLPLSKEIRANQAAAAHGWEGHLGPVVTRLNLVAHSEVKAEARDPHRMLILVDAKDVALEQPT
jgi:hypothetical protein